MIIYDNIKKMKEKFRLIDTGYLTAAENIALDEAMLQAREEGHVPDTIRFLSFKPHAALVGHFQTVEKELREGFCRDHGIDINRRITGGGALYWNSNDVGWEIFSTNGGPFKASGIEEFYRIFCTAVASGINRFGIRSRFRPRNDIEVEGKKISGSGGTSLKDAFLFQGSLLVDLDIDMMLRCLRVPVEKLSYSEISSLKERITWLSREVGRLPARKEIINNILEGFKECLGIEVYRGSLSKKERELFKQKIGYFRSKGHIYRIREKRSQYYLRSMVKTEKGVIKCSANIDIKRKKLKNLYFTGDFFIYPGRAIFDLESILKNIPIENGNISRIVSDFFKNYPGPVSGVDQADINRALAGCFSKIKYKDFKIPLKYYNDIYTVNSEFSASNKIEVLLLPYCSKLPDCKFRYREGCILCEKCSTGDAVAKAQKYGVETITIVDYKHLHRTLAGLKKRGVKYFAGCCCEAFYQKHQQDFERAGLPGILLNIESTTCYELGKQKDAYGGRFEGFTNLKLDLLEKILKLMT